MYIVANQMKFQFIMLVFFPEIKTRFSCLEFNLKSENTAVLIKTLRSFLHAIIIHMLDRDSLS